MPLFSTSFPSSSDIRKLQKKHPSKSSSLGKKATKQAKKAVSSAKRFFKKNEPTGSEKSAGAFSQPFEQAGAVHGCSAQDSAVIAVATAKNEDGTAIPIPQVERRSFGPNSCAETAVDRIYQHYWSATEAFPGRYPSDTEAGEEDGGKCSADETPLEKERVIEQSEGPNGQDDSGIAVEEDGHSPGSPKQQEEAVETDNDNDSEGGAVSPSPVAFVDAEEGGVKLRVPCCPGKWDSDLEGGVGLSPAEGEPSHEKQSSLTFDHDESNHISCRELIEDDVSSLVSTLSQKGTAQISPYESDTEGGEQEEQNVGYTKALRIRKEESIDLTTSEERLSSISILTSSPTPEPVTDSAQAPIAVGPRSAVLKELLAQLYEQFGFKVPCSSPPVLHSRQSWECFLGPFAEVKEGALDEYYGCSNTPEPLEEEPYGNDFVADDDESSSTYSVVTVQRIDEQNQEQPLEVCQYDWDSCPSTAAPQDSQNQYEPVQAREPNEISHAPTSAPQPCPVHYVPADADNDWFFHNWPPPQDCPYYHEPVGTDQQGGIHFRPIPAPEGYQYPCEPIETDEYGCIPLPSIPAPETCEYQYEVADADEDDWNNFLPKIVDSPDADEPANIYSDEDDWDSVPTIPAPADVTSRIMDSRLHRNNDETTPTPAHVPSKTPNSAFRQEDQATTVVAANCILQHPKPTRPFDSHRETQWDNNYDGLPSHRVLALNRVGEMLDNARGSRIATEALWDRFYRNAETAAQ
ncbi:MAG: hypothetical protein M1831_006675 [Alyxoria varia]|nr:MAG: hypothetical protein M1831_006675 [Alyxoria varia]